MEREKHIFHFVAGLVALLIACVSAPSVLGVEAVDVTISPDNFSNTLVVAGESLTQTMVISNAGISDLEFSFCPPSTGEDGLIACYPFNGNADDESGNGHDGLPQGSLSYADGVDGMSARFNGIDAKIMVPHAEDLNLTESLTISCWLKSSGTNPNSGIIAKIQNNTPRNGYLLYANSGYPADVQVNLDKTWPTTMGRAFLTEGFFDGEWHHIVTTYDGETLALYEDGQVEMEVAYTNGLTPNTLPLYIGWDPYYITSQQRYFNGEMDELRIYNRVLSATKIQELFSEFDDGLIARYPLNGNADDESGNGHDGIVNGATLTTDRFGNPDSAYLFDGVDDFIEVPDTEDLRLSNTDFSISTWFYQTSRNASYHDVLITKRGMGSNNGWFYSVAGEAAVIGSTGDLFYQVSAGIDPWAATSVQLPLTEWVHAVMTYDFDAETVRLYINGVLDSERAGIPSPNAASASNMYLGLDSALKGYGFHGALDDVRIYNRALSDTEIQELYAESPECELPDWLSVEPMSGTIPAGASVEVAVTLNASNRVAGDYVEHMLEIYGNGSASPIGSVPVSMWVVPPTPVMVEEPAFTEWTSNEIFWLPVEGPVEYWVETLALEHCSPGRRAEDPDKAIPPGWSNVKRFHDPDQWMQQSDWIMSTNHLFADLHLNTKYQYRAKASVMTDIGRLESEWSEWVESCQVPHVRELDESKVPDSWKQEYFGSSENFCGLVDSDGDGLCDFDEYIAGTLPFDTQSDFEVTECSTCDGGRFVLTWDAVTDRIYSVYWTDSIGEPYQLLEDGICYPQNNYTDTVHNAESDGFYKIEVRLPE